MYQYDALYQNDAVQNGSAFDVTIESLRIVRRFYFLGQFSVNRVCAYVLEVFS
jgi:hypothetical protein